MRAAGAPGISMSLRSHRRSIFAVGGVPFVDYADIDEFRELCTKVEARYARLLFRVVDQHTKQPLGEARFAWTRAEEMLMGIAVFPELYEHGLLVLLRLTRMRGLVFVRAINHTVVVAVTAACRSYCDEHKQHTMENFATRWARGETPVLSAKYVAGVKEHMLRAMLLAVGSACDCNSSMHALHRRCFALLVHPHTSDITTIARHRVPEYALALACITHERLGRTAAGVPLAEQRLHEDTVRMIMGFIDFH